MILLPSLSWPYLLLAAVLVVDALLTIRPPGFISDCLDGVGFPRAWWWVLILVKLLAAAGLILGIWVAGVGFAANVGVIAYFLAAAVAHLRARWFGTAFWVNCLGMLGLSLGVLVLSFLA